MREFLNAELSTNLQSALSTRLHKTDAKHMPY